MNVMPASSVRRVLDRDVRLLVHVEADAVAHPVAEVRTEPGLLDRRAAGRVDVARERARDGGGASRLLRREHRRVRLGVAGGRLAAHDGATEVGRVARHVDGAEVEHHRLALADRLEPARGLRVVALRRSRTRTGASGTTACASRAGASGGRPPRRARPSSRPACTSGAVAAIVSSAMRQAAVISSSSSGDLTRRSLLTSGVPLTSSAPGSARPISIIGLAPRARADAEPADRARATARPCAKSALPSSASLTVTRFAGPAVPQVERDDHARQHEQRIGVGHDERAGDPAVRVAVLAEARQIALQAGQVLEVVGRRDEQRVDARRAHLLRRAVARRSANSVSGMCSFIRASFRGVGSRRKQAARRLALRARRAAAPRPGSARRRTGSAGGSGSRSAAARGRAPRRAAPAAGRRRRRRAGSPRSAPRCTGAAAIAQTLGGRRPISTIRPRYITADRVADVADDRQVVRDQQQPEVELAARAARAGSRPAPAPRRRATRAARRATMHDGSAASARAIAMRCRCPPLELVRVAAARRWPGCRPARAARADAPVARGCPARRPSAIAALICGRPCGAG